MKINLWNIKGLGNSVKRKTISLLRQSWCYLLKRNIILQAMNMSNSKGTGWVRFTSHHTKTWLIKPLHSNSVTDPYSRFVFILGSIYGTPITFLNVYAPNTDEPAFMSDIVLLFNENCKGFGVIGGDFNCMLNSILDQSNQIKKHSSKSSKVLQGLCAECGLTGVWI